MPSSGVQTCALDRKSTRLNSSHTIISYAVFCLKKKIAHRPATRRPAADPLPPRKCEGPPTRCPTPRALVLPPSRLRGVLGRCCFLFFFKRPAPPRNCPSSPPRPPPD